MKVCLKMKDIVKASYTIASSFILQESLEKIVLETCKILECDRASVFLKDEKN